MSKATKAHGGKRAGAGRKQANKEGPAVTISIAIPESLVADVDKLRESNGESRSAFITNAIRKQLAAAKKRSAKATKLSAKVGG